MAQRVGRTESLISKSPTAPPLPGIGPRHSGSPDGPTAKGFVNTGPKFPSTVDEGGVVQSPGTWLAQGPNTCGEDKLSSRGRLTRRVVIGQPSCARPIDAEEDHVPPSLLTVSTQHVPPQSHRARSGRQPTPEAPAGSPGAESGRAEGSQGPKPPGREEGSKNSIEERGSECSRAAAMLSIRAQRICT